MEPKILAYTVDEFCGQVRISRSQFYRLQRRGEGPRLTRLGDRVVVLHETAHAWLKEREALSQPMVLAPEVPFIPHPKNEDDVQRCMEMLL